MNIINRLVEKLFDIPHLITIFIGIFDIKIHYKIVSKIFWTLNAIFHQLVAYKRVKRFADRVIYLVPSSAYLGQRNSHHSQNEKVNSILFCGRALCCSVCVSVRFFFTHSIVQSNLIWKIDFSSSKTKYWWQFGDPSGKTKPLTTTILL